MRKISLCPAKPPEMMIAVQNSQETRTTKLIDEAINKFQEEYDCLPTNVFLHPLRYLSILDQLDYEYRDGQRITYKCDHRCNMYDVAAVK